MTGLAMGCFFNTGQVCAAYSRVLLPASRYDEFAAALVATAESFVVGDPFDPATTMGPLVSARQRDRVLSYIEAGKNEGAVIATGGGIPAGLEKGFYVEPTVFTGAENSMRICREEIFGPVVAVLRYDNLEQAIAIANDSDYGLHGAVFTTDPARAADVARRVRTGTFSVNAFVYNIEAPFGGVKNSGIGRDTGPEAVQAYYELKTVNLDAPTAAMFSQRVCSTASAPTASPAASAPTTGTGKHWKKAFLSFPVARTADAGSGPHTFAAGSAAAGNWTGNPSIQSAPCTRGRGVGIPSTAPPNAPPTSPTSLSWPRFPLPVAPESPACWMALRSTCASARRSGERSTRHRQKPRDTRQFVGN